MQTVELEAELQAAVLEAEELMAELTAELEAELQTASHCRRSARRRAVCHILRRSRRHRSVSLHTCRCCQLGCSSSVDAARAIAAAVRPLYTSPSLQVSPALRNSPSLQPSLAIDAAIACCNLPTALR